ncbi:UDP-N-acetylenolpyruvoylglucosamine reductase [Arcticibacter svalbardensis MN12-7]|uniref:UDP-N-acetylenolpyruvoylglucosamine reductase n=1 Tax=Arcticibacter svalbardensis MN12-7 TaxID=1150600 RepID=R9GP18_9SPHI|nr:UDP-N-acetylmuramate dehydrogenase [Arcticibacter svalbardensis]EOR93468.1 UDP-N-acetylenolpyruvoylglucosamine reductase [Arcticibacter svalbardensis MN12-7]
MLLITENVSLKSMNTFGVEVYARWFTEINAESDLEELFSGDKWKSVPRLIIGGGSNMLFTKNFEGLVIKMNIQGITQRIEGTQVFVTAGGGMVWNDLVKYCVTHGFAGMENLSLIPGSVGASPVQNIGAYGVELKDVFFSCKVYHIATGEMRKFNFADCHFDYRDSIFKRELKNQVVITSVTFELSLEAEINISYGAISHELEARHINNPTIRDVSKVVADIRVAKLPDPSTIGNAGSFFKNPVINTSQFEQIQSAFPDIVHYCLPNSTIKLAAGWMIEQCGWKGKQIGQTATWQNQALVIVNIGNALGTEIYNFSQSIIDDVSEKFGVLLEREVNVI